MVPGQVDKVGQVIEEVGEGDPVLSPDGLPDDDLVDIVEFVPIIILKEKFCVKLRKKEEIIRGVISNFFLDNIKLIKNFIDKVASPVSLIWSTNLVPTKTKNFRPVQASP